MFYFYSDDPVADFHAYDRALQRQRGRTTHCSVCDEPVEEGNYYVRGGYLFCPDCMRERRKNERNFTTIKQNIFNIQKNKE